MKTTFTLLLLALFTLGVNAQLQLPETFEAAESDTTWHQFANSGDDPENIFRTDNPVFNGINESEFCLQLNVLETADPWVGAWAEAYGSVSITADNYMMEMMVMKDVISNCGIKLEAGDGDNAEVKVPNTVTGEWEKLTFDMSVAIGYTYARLVFFPDFPDTREAGSTCYIDNIGFAAPVSTDQQLLDGVKIYPNPVAERMTIRYPEMEGAVISNALGQSLNVKSSVPAKNKLYFDISSLQPGIYYILILSDAKVLSPQKLIVM